jgi:hypothetical protein
LHYTAQDAASVTTREVELDSDSDHLVKLRKIIGS